MTLILASQSPRRLSLLKSIGITPFEVRVSNIDETPLKQEMPRLYASRLAEQKARAVVLNAGEVILAADTVVAVGRRILPKAETNDEVLACLKLMSGRSHRVYTGICALNSTKFKVKCIETRVTVKRFDTQELDEYLASQEGIGKAGGYAIQGLFAKFVVKLSGSYSNVVGLPLFETANLLKQF